MNSEKDNIPAAGACDCCGKSQWDYRFSEKGVSLGCCRNCGLLYISQMPPQQTRIKEMEENVVSNRHTTAATHKKGELSRKEMFRQFIELVKNAAPHGKWLDVGCGTGTLISMAKELDIEISGIELTPDRRELAESTTGATIYNKPIEQLDLSENSLSAVLMIDVFSHLTSPSETFSCIFRVLKPNGILLLYTSEIGSEVKKEHNYLWNLGDHLYFLGEHTVEKYADKIGFKLIHWDKQWAPDLIYSKDNFMQKGSSSLRNFIKTVCLSVPFLLFFIRFYMLKIKNKYNQHYVSTLLLQKEQR